MPPLCSASSSTDTGAQAAITWRAAHSKVRSPETGSEHHRTHRVSDGSAGTSAPGRQPTSVVGPKRTFSPLVGRLSRYNRSHHTSVAHMRTFKVVMRGP